MKHVTFEGSWEVPYWLEAQEALDGLLCRLAAVRRMTGGGRPLKPGQKERALAAVEAEIAEHIGKIYADDELKDNILFNDKYKEAERIYVTAIREEPAGLRIYAY